MRIAVIGGGASGVMCALRIKELRPNYDVTIFEKNNKLLKKVAITGAGRCNICNNDMKGIYYNDYELINNLLSDGYQNYALRYLHGLGLFTYQDYAGRVYPLSDQAQTVVNTLANKVFYSHIKTVLDCNITEIKSNGNKYIVNGETFDKIVISIGSNAGLTEDINTHYSLVKNTNLTALRPGLVGLKVKEDVSELKGVRVNCSVTMNESTEVGELIFKEDGISGICVMNLSNTFEHPCNIHVDLLYDYSFDDLADIIQSRIEADPNLRLHNLFSGAINNKLLAYINKDYPNKSVIELDMDTFNSYILRFKDFTLRVIDTYGFKDGQIVVGGIDLASLDGFKNPSEEIYYTGEVLNVNGICGGYNLWFAFTTGLLVGDELCK